jgi:CRP-like cAMP-binding protein
VAEGEVVKGFLALHWSSVLPEVPLFGALSKRHLRRVVGLVELRHFHPGATVVRAGGAGDAFYLVLGGRARVEPLTGRGRELTAGDYFGELALLDGAPRSATVTAVDHLTVGRISRTAFTGLLRAEPAVAVGLLRGLVAVVRDLQGAHD